MAYVFLLAAIASEVVGTSMLRSTEGFSRLWPTVASLSAYGVSFALLSQAVRQLNVGVVYAMWSGVGTAAIVAVGIAFLGEPVTAAKMMGVALVIGGLVLLNLGGGH